MLCIKLLQVIRVPEGFAVEEGVKLPPRLTVGKMLGGGVQGAVYLLEDANGESTQLLKV